MGPPGRVHARRRGLEAGLRVQGARAESVEEHCALRYDVTVGSHDVYLFLFVIILLILTL